MNKKKKMGRPLTGDTVRDIRFNVRLAKKEHQELLEKAKEHDMNAAEYIRYLIKNDKTKK